MKMGHKKYEREIAKVMKREGFKVKRTAYSGGHLRLTLTHDAYPTPFEIVVAGSPRAVDAAIKGAVTKACSFLNGRRAVMVKPVRE